jgi:hypothetical protein
MKYVGAAFLFCLMLAMAASSQYRKVTILEPFSNWG